MQLIIITSVAEFDKEVKKMLKKAMVTSYSYQEVKGISDTTNEAMESNWFGSEVPETDSLLFYAFVAETNVATLFNIVEEFNQKQETLSKIHLAVVAVTQHN
jgi:nitrogen regulatory protein PII